MIHRLITGKIEKALKVFPVVAIIGPRQTGKTTLVRLLESKIQKTCLFLDMERTSDLQKLDEPELFLSQQVDKCVIIDEIQHKPDILPLLRWLIDQHRQPARFIITGSSTPDLIRNNTESLAGRIAYFELHPFSLPEIIHLYKIQEHWFRGGFPLALMAQNDEECMFWLENFTDTYIQRDIRQLGYEISVSAMSRLLQVLASMNGKILNLQDISNSMDISYKTLTKYLDILEGSFIIRRLTPYHVNTTKRLVRSPKIYFRDTGLLHNILRIGNLADLHGTIHLGASWESYVIEQIILAAGKEWQFDYYRTHAGAEVDLIMSGTGKPKVMLEIKYSTDPKLSRGFHESAVDIKPDYKYIIIPEGEPWLRNENQKVCGIREFIQTELPHLVK